MVQLSRLLPPEPNPTPGVSRWTPEYRRQYQREYRQGIKERGGMRIHITLEPKVVQALGELLKDEGFDTHPGAALQRWLEWQLLE